MSERNPDPMPVDLSRLHDIVDRQAQAASDAYGRLITEAMPIERRGDLTMLPDLTGPKARLLADLFMAAVKRKVDDVAHGFEQDVGKQG